MRHKVRKREQFMKKALDGTLNWEYMVSRYVWDSEKTPYFTRISRLNTAQALSEITFYAVIIGIAATVFTFKFSTTGLENTGANQLAAVYCFVVFSAALTLGILKEPVAAIVCASFPVVGMARILLNGGFLAGHDTTESVLIFIGFAAIAVYSYRLVHITRNYHDGVYVSAFEDSDD